MIQRDAIAHVNRVELSKKFDLGTVLAITAVLVTVVGTGFATFYIRQNASAEIKPPGMAEFIFPFILFVPIGAVLFTYATVSDEQTSGSLRMSLAAPYDRQTVLLGKALSSLLLSILPAIVGYLAVVVAVSYFGPIEPLTATVFAVGTALMTVAFVNTTLYFSVQYANHTPKALVNAAGFVVISVFIWPIVTNLLTILLSLPETASAAVGLSMPTPAYQHLIEEGFNSVVSMVAVASLAFWCVVPFVVARRRFERLDVA